MSRNNRNDATFPLLLLVLFSIVISSMGFAPIIISPNQQTNMALRESAAGGGGGDPSDIIAKKITVTGDVDGGYFRSCVKNEVRVAWVP